MTICRLVLLSVALPALVQGQSLGDQARKERERREKLRKAGTASHVVTEDELLSAPGRLASLPSAEEPSAEAETSTDAETSADAGTNTYAGGKPEENQPRPIVKPRVVRLAIPEPTAPPEPRAQQGEPYWRALAEQTRDRLRMAEARYRLLDRAIRIGQPHMYDQNGQRVIYSQQQMKVMADAAQADVEAARKALDDLLDQARRAGALPGWLRER